jgi:two-component system, LytTR family, response regulator
VRALIVDHEPRARATLRHLCEADENIDEVAVADCGTTAIEMIGATRPDLLFLDVELKDMTGFEVLRSVENARPPAVIVVAAHEGHVMEAFSSGAIDYLTKPVGASRFATAIEKVQDRYELSATTMKERVPATANTRLGAKGRGRAAPIYLMAEKSHRLYFLAAEEVDYIESCGNYAVIHVGEQKYVLRDTLQRLTETLRGAGFERIHRTILVNLARVAFAEEIRRGALVFTLTNGTRLVSRAKLDLEAGRASNHDDEP